MSNPPSSPPERPTSRRPILIHGLAAILGLVSSIVFSSRSDQSLTEDSVPETVSTAEPTPSNTPDSSFTAPSDSQVAPIPVPDLAPILDDYMVPGRMVFFQIHLTDAGAITLSQAQSAVGRAKPAPIRNMLGWIRVDAFDANDQLTFSHTVEDPTRRFLEHPASSDDGRMTRTIIEQESGSLFVRVPGESLATRLVLSRWNPNTSNASAPWEAFNTIEFPQ